MTQQDSPYDGASLLEALRDLNNTARDAATGPADESYPQEYAEAATRLSDESAAAAQAAENALRDLEAGDPVRAKQYLDRMAHIMGMVALATNGQTL